MRTINFNTNPTILVENKQQINEFIGTMLVGGVVCWLLSNTVTMMMTKQVANLVELKKAMNDLGIGKSKEEKEKERAEKERKKEEKERKKEEKRLRKQAEKEKKKADANLIKATKQMLALEETIDKMPDGKHKDDLGERLAAFNRIIRGEATKDDMDNVEKESKRELSKKEQLQISACSKEISEIPDSKAENMIKDKKYSIENISKSAATAGMIKEPIESIDDLTKDSSDNENNNGEENKNDEVIKDMEVEDPDTGKKVMRKVHIGPKGGRYYWPDKSPHDAEHKVYINK